MKRVFLRNLSLFLTVIFCLCLFSACSASAKADSFDEAGYPEMTTAAQKPVYAADNSDFSEEITLTGAGEKLVSETVETDGSLYTPQDGRKMIRNARLQVETEQYEASVQAIQTKIAETGAYLESSSANGYSEYHSRYTTLTVRVPAERFEEFLSAQNDFGAVIESEVSQEDITLHYTDLESRLNTLNTKKERLTALLEKADKMEDIISLESALAETISEIESYTAQMNQLENLISYCTVTIHLSEVYRVTPIDTQPKTLGERIEQRFRNSTESLGAFFEDFAVFLVGESPVLILLAVIITGVTMICVSASRRKKRKWEAARRAAADAKKED